MHFGGGEVSGNDRTLGTNLRVLGHGGDGILELLQLVWPGSEPSSENLGPRWLHYCRSLRQQPERRELRLARNEYLPICHQRNGELHGVVQGIPAPSLTAVIKLYRKVVCVVCEKHSRITHIVVCARAVVLQSPQYSVGGRIGGNRKGGPANPVNRGRLRGRRRG